MQNDRKRVYLYGYLGILGALLVGLGEFLVHFSADYDPAIPYNYFLGIPEWRFTLGHFLMIIFVPSYIYGYWHLFLSLQGRVRIMGKAVLSLGIVAFIIGGIWMGSRAMLGMTIQAQAAAGEGAAFFDGLILFYDDHLEILNQFLWLMIVVISGLFIWAILEGITWYPRWMVFFNPLLLLGLIYLFNFLVPTLGKYLMATAMNIAHLLLFIASMIALKQEEQGDQKIPVADTADF